MALSLACIGFHGVIAYSVIQRSRAMVGLVLSIAGALVFARYLRALLFEIQPSDPATVGVVAGLIVVMRWPTESDH